MNHNFIKYENLAEKFKSIGHPVRVAILDLLCNCGADRLTVKSIYEKLKLDQPVISRHLGIMRKNGVLMRMQESGFTFYCLCNHDPHVQCIRRCFIKIIFSPAYSAIQITK